MSRFRAAGSAPAGAVALVILAAMTIAGSALAASYAGGVPPWNAPDEPAHFNYIRHIATTGQLPELKQGDWNAPMLERLKSTKFPSSQSIDSIRYESHQPPLYYLLGAAVYNTRSNVPLAQQVEALRYLSVVLAAMTVVVAFLTVRVIFPQDVPLQLAVAGFIAFLPMRSFIMGSINSDALTELVSALTLLLLVWVGKAGFGKKQAVLLGLTMGALLLTKMTDYGYVLLGIVGVVMATWGKGGSSKRETVMRLLALSMAIAVLISGWWFIRNGMVYGPTDIFGMQRHDQIMRDQPRLEKLDATALAYFVPVLFKSFWGQFGWMGIPMDERVYLALELFSGLAALGLVLFLVRSALDKAILSPHQRYCLAIMALAAVGVAVQVTLYNLMFVQAQGRYLYPALLPIALFFVLGLRELMAPVHARLLLALSVSGLALLDFVSLTKLVLPYFG